MDGVDVGGVLELSAPGVQDTRQAGEVGADDAFVFGAAFEGERRGGEHGLVREALMRADEESERLRDGKGEEKVWPRELCVQVVI